MNRNTRRGDDLLLWFAFVSLFFPVITSIFAVSLVLKKTAPLRKTLIMHAASEGNLRELRSELKNHLDHHSVEEIAGALNLAAAHGHRKVIVYLLSLGANPNGIASKNRLFNHPLAEAVKSGQTEIVRTLLKYGASAKMRDGHGNTAMHWAAIHGFHRMVRLLVAYHAPINQKNGLNRTPLMEAAKWGHKDIVHFLTQKGASIEESDLEGDTALSLAKKNQHHQIVLSLEKSKEGMKVDRHIATQVH